MSLNEIAFQNLPCWLEMFWRLPLPLLWFDFWWNLKNLKNKNWHFVFATLLPCQVRKAFVDAVWCKFDSTDFPQNVNRKDKDFIFRVFPIKCNKKQNNFKFVLKKAKNIFFFAPGIKRVFLTKAQKNALAQLGERASLFFSHRRFCATQNQKSILFFCFLNPKLENAFHRRWGRDPLPLGRGPGGEPRTPTTRTLWRGSRFVQSG